MKTIALVGGIGSGKSTIAHMFAELGAGIINLDDVGHFVLTTPGVKYDIARTFGANVFDERGEVVRSRLAAPHSICPSIRNGLTPLRIPSLCRSAVAASASWANCTTWWLWKLPRRREQARCALGRRPGCRGGARVRSHGTRLYAWQPIDCRCEPSYRFAENRRAACGDRRFHHRQRQRS